MGNMTDNDEGLKALFGEPKRTITTDFDLVCALNEFWGYQIQFILYEIMPYKGLYAFVDELFWLLMNDNKFRKTFIKNPATIKLKLDKNCKLKWVQ